jgi:hypothetical protein
MEPAIAAIMVLLSCNPDAPEECVELPLQERRYATIGQCQERLSIEIDRLQTNDNLIKGGCRRMQSQAVEKRASSHREVIDPITTGSILPDYELLDGDTANVRVTSHSPDGSVITRDYKVPRTH